MAVWVNPLAEELDDDELPQEAGWGGLIEAIDRLRPDWQADALCREYVDTVTWFPERGQSAQPAKDVCNRCAVREECWRYAAGNDVRAGVWGAETFSRRRR